MLSEKKKTMIDLLIEGKHNRSEIAKLIDVSRTTLYEYLNDPMVIEELDKRVTEVRNQSVKNITSRIEPVIDELFTIALTATDVRSRTNACQYLVDRVLGKPKSVVDIEANTKQPDPIDFDSELDDIIEEVDNEEE